MNRAVGPPDVRQSVSGDVDEVICLETPARLHSIGAHYRDFRQITDDPRMDRKLALVADHPQPALLHRPQMRAARV